VIGDQRSTGHALVAGVVVTLVNGKRGAEADSDGGDPSDAKGEGARDADPVELGVELLRKFEGSELSVAAAVDRIETVSTDPAITREVLDQAERRGVIERENGILRTRDSGFVRYESEVISKDGEFTCRRCGTDLGTGYFLKLEAGEHGPFGSSCIRKVTGRERE
jgi:hypothetical protein